MKRIQPAQWTIQWTRLHLTDRSIMKKLFVFVLLAAVAAPGQTQKTDPNPFGKAKAPPSAAAGDDSTLKVDVKLVSLFVSVTDPRGAPVGDLQKENFSITEDDVPQKIAVFSRESSVPLSIVLAIDTSLSTKKDLPVELVSARKFAHAILRPTDTLAVYKFSEIVTQVVPFTNDMQSIDRGIDNIRVGAATALFDAIFLGSQALDKRQGRKVMVLITDGGDTASQTDYKGAVRAAQEAEALVYSVIIVPIEASAGRDTGGEHALIQLSEDTGAKYYYASSMNQLDEAFRKISDELRTQYLLGYYPVKRFAESDFRQLEVTVSGNSSLHVRHRTGYYTAKSTW